MRVDSINLKHNKFVTDYRNQTDQIKSFFEYNPFTSYAKRLKYIDEKDYQRQKLSSILKEMNHGWGADHSTLNNIDRLKEEDAVVVVGGQQAGLLTGPLYSINKVISIIQLAKAEEEKLNRPVIPVFWIAGEDHDFDEINHINQRTEKGIIKQKTHHIPEFKKSVSQIELDEDLTKQWLTRIFLELEESTYTKLVYEDLLKLLNESKTYVDFFARLISKLFSETGLVLIDSANENLRSMESAYFIKLIEHQEAIAKNIKGTIKTLQENDYAVSLDVEENDGHLFYHDDHGERILLYRTDSADWQGKNNDMIFTTSELIEIAKNSPQSLSNNVVTRPLMQEWLFPTLAFIGGYGEISYWASLKSAFKEVNLEMPPIVPRHSITYIPQAIEQVMNKNEIKASQAINDGVNHLKQNWLSNQSNVPIELLVEEMNKGIAALHEPLQKVAADFGSDLQQLAETNLEKIFNTTEFIEKRLLKEINNKYKKQINEYDLITDYLYPNNGLQERVWSPLLLINEYGFDVIKKMTKQAFSFTENHYVVYL